jgi:3-deoxy-7-phosphoheptulonate synthase
MIVAMQDTATDEQIQQVVEHLIRMGFSVHRTTGERQTVLAAVGARVDFDTRNLEVLSGVEHVHRISAPYKLAGRSFRPQGTIIELAHGVQIGGDQVVVMAGPCSVESRAQLFTVAEHVAKAGARVLRGGAFKPRSSPYSFQGMGEEGLKLLREAGDHFKLLVISEVMEISQIALMLPYIDIFQVAICRTLICYELGRSRSLFCSNAASQPRWKSCCSRRIHVAGSSYEVILCERGIRTFETYTVTLDVSAIPIIRASHLPMTSDPSHGTGLRDKVPPMAQACWRQVPTPY